MEIERWPQLREPVMVLALSGWVDAGLAGVGAVATLADQLESGARFARVDLADLADLQQTRPTVHLVDGVTREVVWPSVDLVAGRAGRDVVLVHGPEPSIRWHAFTEELVGVARRLDVRLALALGGMPVTVSHRRPVRVLATATSHALAQESGATRANYAGPTGVQTVVQHALGQAGVPAIGLWAQVPHYVAATPSPPAIRALLERVRELAGVHVELRSLDTQSDEYVARIEEGLAERPDVAELVSRLDEAEPDTLPSGDELVSEIERFLRGEH